MPIIDSTDASTLIGAAATAVVDLVKAAFGEAGSAVLDLANNEDMSPDDRVRLLTELTEIAKGTGRGFTPGTVPTLALGAGTPAPTADPGAPADPATETVIAQITALARDIGGTTDIGAFVTNLVGSFGPIIAEAQAGNRTEANRRIAQMTLAANGETVSIDDLRNTEQQLSDANNARVPGSLAAQLATALRERDAARADLATAETHLLEEQDENHAGSQAQLRKAAEDALAPVTTERDALQVQVDTASADYQALHHAVTTDGRIKRALGRAAGLRPELKQALGL